MTISPFKIYYFLDQEYMLSHKPHPSQREEGSGHATTIELSARNTIIEHMQRLDNKMLTSA